MSQDRIPKRDRIVFLVITLAGAAAGGIVLLAGAYGFKLGSMPVVWWRDHPFDFGNLVHAGQTMLSGARLWAWDPMHLFGWSPHVFYNPLASGLAGLFIGAGGFSHGAYRLWLVLVLVATSAVFAAFVPVTRVRVAALAGVLLAAWSSLLIYPGDVGVIDANPVQVFYTGQWAQRLGVALGLLGLERYWRALTSLGADRLSTVYRALAAAALLGAAAFTHYMSGYAAAAAMGLLTLWHLAALRLRGDAWRPGALLLFLAVLVACALLFADFVYALVAGSALHDLPLLEWYAPLAALASVREVVVPALPVLLLPIARRLIGGETRGLVPGAFPLLVLAAVWLATPASMLLWLLLLVAASLACVRMQGEIRPAQWLPVLAWFLLTLACGPDSLRPWGLDLTVLVPFAGSLGWVKLAAFSRFLVFAWLGLLVWEGLTRAPGGRALTAPRIGAGALALLGLVIPLALSLSARLETHGARSFVGWMRDTDPFATLALLDRMQAVAMRTPRSGFLLVEDSLHHAEGSGLSGRHIPHGHLPYLTAQTAGRPVLGGAVTTRWVTHPHAHTSRGQLLCQDFETIEHDPGPVLDRLRSLGISDVLAHSPALIRSLQRYPAALEVDREAGLTHFALEHYRPVLTAEDGGHIPGADLRWLPDGVEIELPEGATGARLRLVLSPFLDCEIVEAKGPASCALSSWSDGEEVFTGCRVARPGDIHTTVPWIRIEVEAGAQGPVRLRLANRPAWIPFLVMLLAWAAALTGRLWWLRRIPGLGRPDE